MDLTDWHCILSVLYCRAEQFESNIPPGTGYFCLYIKVVKWTEHHWTDSLEILVSASTLRLFFVFVFFVNCRSEKFSEFPRKKGPSFLVYYKILLGDVLESRYGNKKNMTQMFISFKYLFQSSISQYWLLIQRAKLLLFSAESSTRREKSNKQTCCIRFTSANQAQQDWVKGRRQALS